MLFEIAHAAEYWDSIFWATMSFWDFILLAISLFVLASWIFSIIFILWGGLLLILSWGKDEKIKPAINTIRFAIIGIVMTVLTIFAFPILAGLLWLDVEKYAEPKRIFEKIESIWAKIFWNETKSTFDTDIEHIDEFPTDFSDL